MARNLPKLLDTKAQSKNIQCLHGMRALSMFWVILGHSYVWDNFSSTTANPTIAFKVLLEFPFQAVSNAYFAVDTFFFLGGVLVMYLTYRRMKEANGRFPWIAYYLHRLWRLTPTYLIVLLVFWQLVNYWGDGPVWDNMMAGFQKDCDSYWWTNLLYVNNFHPANFSDECMGWSWYLANDMQMHVISPIIIIPAFIFGFLGLLVPLGLCLLGVLLSLSLISHRHHFPANAMTSRESRTYGNEIYSKFYTRAAPYLVGLFLGYWLARTACDGRYTSHPLVVWIQKRKKVFVPLAWLLAFALGITVIYGVYDFNRGNGDDYPQAVSTLYITFSYFLWPVALALLVFLCHTGNGGIINTFLSWSGWVPLSRLTYSAYLLHPIVLSFLSFSTRAGVYFSHRVMVYRFVGVVGISYFCALLLSLAVEYPCAAMEKVIRKSLNRK